ncbi:TrmH family RNA methyltransferase [Schaalia suimastitidis]|uniref:TrmH family RNA methyltransferase n=1 Tax=Schaalia suimastitidis TaxID=121163 RepID=UPI0006845F2E|nr:TrmH family RNA methyltransferase [Schaalia suimastitidis]
MPTHGVGPWEGPWPSGDQWDVELLKAGDRRNVEDQYRYWTMDAIRADIAARTLPFEVAIENLEHDFNIGSIVRTANALGASRIHIVGRRRWNRRGAMVTDRYMDVVHHDDAHLFGQDCRARGVEIVGVDIIPGATPIDAAPAPVPACLVFGGESDGLSEQMLAQCAQVVYIPQRGSTRSMNVGHAAAITMWTWVQAYLSEGRTSHS